MREIIHSEKREVVENENRNHLVWVTGTIDYNWVRICIEIGNKWV